MMRLLLTLGPEQNTEPGELPVAFIDLLQKATESLCQRTLPR